MKPAQQIPPGSSFDGSPGSYNAELEARARMALRKKPVDPETAFARAIGVSLPSQDIEAAIEELGVKFTRPPSPASVEDRVHRDDELRAARARQTVRYAVAPGASIVMASGYSFGPGSEVTPGMFESSGPTVIEFLRHPCPRTGRPAVLMTGDARPAPPGISDRYIVAAFGKPPGPPERCAVTTRRGPVPCGGPVTAEDFSEPAQPADPGREAHVSVDGRVVPGRTATPARDAIDGGTVLAELVRAGRIIDTHQGASK